MMRISTHSPDAHGILNPGALEAVLSSIQEANPDYRLVGSLGRAVLYDAYYDDPYREYDARQELPLRSVGRTARDIDLLGAQVQPEIASPYDLDTVWGHNKDAAIIKEGSKWRLRSDIHNFDQDLPDETMEPVIGRTVYGIKAVTVRPQTHLALFAVRNNLKRKDAIPVQLLGELLLCEEAQLPESTYDAFYDLADLQRKTLKARIRRMISR